MTNTIGLVSAQYQELIEVSKSLGDAPRFKPGGYGPGEGILDTMHFLGNIHLNNGQVGDAYIKKGSYRGEDEDGIGVWVSDNKDDHTFQVEHGFRNIQDYGCFVKDQVIFHEGEADPLVETSILATNTGLKLAIAKGIVNESKLVRLINPLESENRFELEGNKVDPVIIEMVAKMQGFADSSAWEEAWRDANIYVKDAQPRTYNDGEQTWWYDIPDLIFVWDLLRAKANDMPVSEASMQRLVVKPLPDEPKVTMAAMQNQPSYGDA
jgi:hypothetical protein